MKGMFTSHIFHECWRRIACLLCMVGKPVIVSVEMAWDGGDGHVLNILPTIFKSKNVIITPRFGWKPVLNAVQSRPLYLYVDFALAISLSTFASRCSCFGLSGPRQLSIHKASGTCARFCVLKSFLVHLGTHCTACSLFSWKSWSRLRNSCYGSTTCSLDGQSLESMPEFLESFSPLALFV